VWIAGGASIAFALLAIPVSRAWPGASDGLVLSFLTLSVVCNWPHYAATYEIIHRERRTAPDSYRTLLWSVPVFFALLLIGGVYVEAALPPLARVYFTWSAYHYGAQHFGLAAMYAARSGAPLDLREKRGLQVAFAAVALFQMLLLNSNSSSAVRSYEAPTSPAPVAIGWLTHGLLPAWTYYVVLLLFMVGLASFVATSLRRAGRGCSLPFPVFLLFATHVAWFVLPNLRLRAEDPPWVGPVVGSWLPSAIPFFHCAQYLGVVGWRARTTGAVRPLFWGGTLVLVGWMLFDGLGFAWKMVFSRAAMQMALVTGLVNIHHFWVDGLIWRRRRMPLPVRADLAVST
jgi:hypothetical protein